MKKTIQEDQSYLQRTLEDYDDNSKATEENVSLSIDSARKIY